MQLEDILEKSIIAPVSFSTEERGNASKDLAQYNLGQRSNLVFGKDQYLKKIYIYI